MSPDAFIRFDHVSKKFRKGAVHDSLRDLLPAIGRRIISGRPPAGLREKEFWAVRDISFDVLPGEVLGIIGSNGAGKSTTLKLLNRILQPTSGLAEVRGRVGALIEVSAGFHPDLSGRQNVFLQGAIMGMRRQEVQRKFDEIVSFAGLEEFIGTPVKRYSSGMNARLGFSIAAHLEPDVLLIDEVLAVGDHAFQTKAFGRIREMARAGAPVVIVSHQLDRIKELCTKAILLEQGSIRIAGTPGECIAEYMVGAKSASASDAVFPFVRFDTVRSLSEDLARSGDRVGFAIEGEVLEPLDPLLFTPLMRVVNLETGEHLHATTGSDRSIHLSRRGSFRHEITLQLNLAPGMYFVEYTIWSIEDRKDASGGLKLNLEVFPGLSFWGSTQLNTEWFDRRTD